MGIPIALPPVAVDNDDEFAHVSPDLAFQLGCEWERFLQQFRTWASSRSTQGTFRVHGRLAHRVRQLAQEHRMVCTIHAAVDPQMVKALLSKGAR